MMNVKERVLAYKDEMIETLAKLVSYNSELDTSNPDYPFGQVNAECLHAALEICAANGMKTVNLDNYIGYGELGEGEEVVGVIGHLDIVPAGEGWNTDPFVLTEKDGKLYGRGSSDDKGGVVASLYALKILQDMGVEFTKRVRLIMGCNEETGSKCLAYYVKKEGDVDYGFTPDAMFPGTFGEKGMVAATFSAPSEKILDIKGGAATNVVCAHVETKLAKGACNLNQLKASLISNDVKFTVEEHEAYDEIHVFGVAAHASTPEHGRNAISFLMDALYDAGIEDEFVTSYHKMIGLSTDGAGCDVKLNDDYGALTLNVGVIGKKENVITATIDIRFPVTLTSVMVTVPMEAAFKTVKAELNIHGAHEPLFLPLDSDLVRALVSAYQSVTGDTETQPMTMGGGTYAKGIKNTIAFGGGFPNSENCHMHDANEFIKVDELLLQTEIYVQAILNILAL